MFFFLLAAAAVTRNVSQLAQQVQQFDERFCHLFRVHLIAGVRTQVDSVNLKLAPQEGIQDARLQVLGMSDIQQEGHLVRDRLPGDLSSLLLDLPVKDRLWDLNRLVGHFLVGGR